MPYCFHKSPAKRAFVHALAIVVMLFAVFSGCGKRGTKPPMGAATIDELIARYRRAHENKDIEDLRGILQWESQLPYHRPPLEDPMRALFDMPLAEVRYVARPKDPNDIGGQARYLLAGAGGKPQDDGMIGPICGKILLVEKAKGGRKPRIIDASYIVTQFKEFDNRYYIDVLEPVAQDAARAYKTKSLPKYTPQPLEAIVSPKN